MRPRLLHLGYRYRRSIRGTGSWASMRPRLLHLGYLPTGANRNGALAASMRPRLLHLGYGALPVVVESIAPLLQ